MTLTLEQLLTAPAGFALATASPLQRAVCRIADGLPLGELARDPDVIAAVGDVSSLPLGERPAALMILSGIRVGKSLLAAALAVRATQTISVAGLGPGETPRVSILSLTVDLSRVVFDHLTGNVRAQPALRALLVDEPTADSVTLRHPSGRPIEIKVVAGARAGASLVARWSAGAIFDEAPRMQGADDGVVNYDDARAAVIGRLLPGAQLVAIGSPWAPFGPIWEAVSERWGKPSRELVVVRAPASAFNPVYWTPARCAALLARDPDVYRTDVLAEFADPEAALFAAGDLARITRDAPVERAPIAGVSYLAACDPATRGNSWPLIIAHAEGYAEKRRIVVDLARQWTGSRSAPLSPDAVLIEMASLCRAYGVSTVYTDQFSADAIADLAKRRGLRMVSEAVTVERKRELYEGLRTQVATGAIELPPTPEIRSDLLSVRKVVTQNGVAYVLPRTSDGRHADYAAAIALAVAKASGGKRLVLPSELPELPAVLRRALGPRDRVVEGRSQHVHLGWSVPAPGTFTKGN